MDGRKNVSISHILPGGRYASAADSWISPWTARSDRGLVKISQQQYFSALFLLTHVTPSHVTPACGSSDQGIEDIDSSSHVV